MLSRGPNPNSGDSRAATWLRRLLAAVQANKLLPGIGYKLKHSTLGTTLEINPGKGGPGKLEMCQISALYGSVTPADYFSVYSFIDGATTGSEFYVAKSIPSRMHTARSYYGTSYSYTYTDDNNRTSDDEVTEEEQVVLEPFVVGDGVFVMDVGYTGVTVATVGVKKIEVNTEREWCGPEPA